MTIQRQLISALRAQHKKKPDRVVGTLIDQSTDDELCRMLFANYRGTKGRERGLHLSQGGLAVMQGYFKLYPVYFDPTPIYNARHVLFFDRICKLPWAVDKDGVLWLMDAEFAMRAKLVGDLDAFMSAFAP